MKNYYLLTLLLLIASLHAYSQSVTEYVSFDYYSTPTDNDYENNFSNGAVFSQITTDGITGGCLITPWTESWGNDNAIYCSKYVHSNSFTTNTRISFKYDSTQINTANFDRAVTIYLRPNADFNHYIIASIMHDKKIQIISYSAVNNPYLVNLQHNHWYEFILTSNCITPAPVYQITATAQLNDLGLTGLTPPIPAGNSSVSFNDSLLFVDDAIQVSFSGTLWGGAKYIDNFRYQGEKSADSCNTTIGLASYESNDVTILFHENTLHISHDQPKMNVEIYSISGQKLFSSVAYYGETVFPVSDFENGVYLVRTFSDDPKMGNSIKKFVLLNP